MRKSGLCLALIASAQFALLSSPAFAQDTSGAPPPPAVAPAAAVPATATPATAAPTPAPTGTVKVHIDSTSTVTLQKRSGDSGTWETVCTSPCDASAPVDAQYQIIGDNLNASKPFMLDSSKGKVNLDVTPGSQGRAKVGMGFLIAGGVVTVAGIVVAIASSGHGFVASDGGSGNTNLGHTNGVFAAGALIFVGIGLGLYGAGTMVANNHTSVDGNVARPQPTRGSADSVLKTAQEPIANTPTFMMPVLSGQF